VLGAELEVPGEREEPRARRPLSHRAERVEAGYEPRKVASLAVGAVGDGGVVGGGGAAGEGNSGEDPGVDVVVALFVDHEVEVAPLAPLDLAVGAFLLISEHDRI
jgi:hypothetical protein